jgi:hypothetical protein
MLSAVTCGKKRYSQAIACQTTESAGIRVIKMIVETIKK